MSRSNHAPVARGDSLEPEMIAKMAGYRPAEIVEASIVQYDISSKCAASKVVCKLGSVVVCENCYIVP